jgi:hypothetical protein
MSVHEAWSLVCRLFSGGRPVLRAALSAAELRAFETLGAPFPSGIEWCPLEERFVFYSGRISLIGGSSGFTAEEPSPSDASVPVYGSFDVPRVRLQSSRRCGHSGVCPSTVIV